MTEYLREKIKRTNVNNSKANAGCRILKGYSQFVPDIEYLVNEAIIIIEEAIHRDSSTSARGEAPLTYTSHRIGQETGNYLKLDLPWHDCVRLGDLFIEGFYNNEIIDLNYEQTRDSCHTITLIADIDFPNFKIKGSSTIKPTDISKMMQVWRWESEEERTKAVIKGKKANDSHIIRHNRDAQWLTAINKLQQQPWRIDSRVLEAIVNSPQEFPETDDKDIQQRYDSKRRERRAIIQKAQKLENVDFYQYISTDYRGRIYYEEPFLNFQGSDWARGMMKFAEGKLMTETGLWWLAIHTANSFNQSFNIDEIPDWAEADYKSYLSDEGLDSISVDKMTLEDRVRWTNENMEIIYEVADRGYIWDSAEKPVSFLAACLEWTDYERTTSSGREYVSYLPIPIDGSNNGWQHLGAMSKDPRTGELVGLIPTEIQRDFYVQTAKELYRLTTDERRKAILDSMPMKHIRKGISKRGSMTRAYSAGAKKIAENMWLDCRTEDFHEKYDITEEDCLGFANDLIKAIDAVCPGPLQTMSYLQSLAQYEIGIRKRFLNGKEAEKEFQALRKQLNKIWDDYNKAQAQFPPRSKERQDWKQNNSGWFDSIKDKEYEIRDLISRFETKVTEGNGSALLIWITPSGFPVEYEAFQVRPVKVMGTITGYDKYRKDCRVSHIGQEATDSPDINKFVCGVSPNFIHSLDASHMCSIITDWSGCFGPVHDSFSTHACDVEDLVAKTKHHFVKMYDCENYFDRIRYQLTCNTDDVDQPDRGKLDINEVYESDYFFA